MIVKSVLDASAILTVLNNERGEEKVMPLLADSVVSTVNLAEVGAKLLEAGMNEEDARIAVSMLGIGEIIEFNEALAWETAKLRLLTKPHGLSLGDRVCLALAMQFDVPAITADKEWSQLNFCAVILIR